MYVINHKTNAEVRSTAHSSMLLTCARRLHVHHNPLQTPTNYLTLRRSYCACETYRGAIGGVQVLNVRPEKQVVTVALPSLRGLPASVKLANIRRL